MKVVQLTPDVLLLDERPMVLGIVLIAAVLALATFGLAMLGQTLWAGMGMLGGAAVLGLLFAVFVRRTIVRFDRAAGRMDRRESTVLGQSAQSLPLPRIAGAAVDSLTARGSQRSSTTHRCVLTLQNPTEPPMPLTLVYASGTGAQQAATTINRWLAGELP